MARMSARSRYRTRRIGDGDEMIACFSPQHGIRMDGTIYGCYGSEDALRALPQRNLCILYEIGGSHRP
ncbi:unnamed protein product [Lasius platythorax]|uniref:Uncharacterized protein n=1 Tax=Lasius platythorax TaxID=488582 RepID=A0AAV2P179_9HYME